MFTVESLERMVEQQEEKVKLCTRRAIEAKGIARTKIKDLKDHKTILSMMKTDLLEARQNAKI